MGDIFPQRHLRWTFATSAILHVGIALLLLIGVRAHKAPVPVGVEMLYLGEAQSAPRPAVKRPKNAEIAVSKEPVAEPAASSVANESPAGARDGVVVSALERYKFELRLFLESRKIYPETAKRLRQVGTVVVQFKVDSTGELTEVNIERPSSSEILNRSAQDLVKTAPRFKPIPLEANASELHLSLPIEYIL